MAKKIDYDIAYKELQEIVEKLQDDDLKIEKLSEYIQKANELKTYCYNRLRAIEEDIEKHTKS